MPAIVLDEHVSRVFESTLQVRGFEVVQVKDELGEALPDRAVLEWCADQEMVLITNNARDFEQLHTNVDHAGVFLYRAQDLPDTDPEGLARTVELVFYQYDRAEITNQLVELDEWYRWLQGA